MAPPEAEIVVDVPVEEAWLAITDPDELSVWFGAEVELEPAPLGRATFHFPDGSERFAIVEEVDAPHRLAWRWWPAGNRSAATRVAIELEPLSEAAADETRVTVVESAA
jgi:uncharacterized protein YndB with AHSA1/START domain